MGDEVKSPRLSILLATVTNRAPLFALLHAELQRQAEGKPVEIIVACDNKEISIGKKRQNLLLQATGYYVTYIDDDDWVPPYYVDRILSALSTGPDCVGFLIECTTNGHSRVMAKASMCYKQWMENRDGFAHVRSPYHKTPHLRSIGLRVGFPDLRFGEDRPYSAGITRLIKTEVFINAVCYYYRYNSVEPFHGKYGLPTPAQQARITRSRPVSRRKIASPRYDYKGRRVG